MQIFYKNKLKAPYVVSHLIYRTDYLVNSGFNNSNKTFELKAAMGTDFPGWIRRVCMGTETIVTFPVCSVESTSCSLVSYSTPVTTY